MRERKTVRILLLDPMDRLLLMRGRMVADGIPAWFTVGGGLEPGESINAGALREIAEETGFSDVVLGPQVWLRDATGHLPSGERVLLRETYLFARCAGLEPSREGWEPHENDLVDDLCWWSLADLKSCPDPVYPERLLDLLPELLTGCFPDPPLVISPLERLS